MYFRRCLISCCSVSPLKTDICRRSTMFAITRFTYQAPVHLQVVAPCVREHPLIPIPLPGDRHFTGAPEVMCQGGLGHPRDPCNDSIDRQLRGCSVPERQQLLGRPACRPDWRAFVCDPCGAAFHLPHAEVMQGESHAYFAWPALAMSCCMLQIW